MTTVSGSTGQTAFQRLAALAAGKRKAEEDEEEKKGKGGKKKADDGDGDGDDDDKMSDKDDEGRDNDEKKGKAKKAKGNKDEPGCEEDEEEASEKEDEEEDEKKGKKARAKDEGEDEDDGAKKKGSAAAAVKIARLAERRRIQAIMDSEYASRSDAHAANAQYLAFETEMDSKTAIGMLRCMQVADVGDQKKPAANAARERLDKTPNPPVSNESTAGTPTLADQIIAAGKKRRGEA